MHRTAHIGRNSPVIGADREQLALGLKSLYESGWSVRDLAKQTGRSYGTVHRLLREARTNFRSYRGQGPSAE
ncbi:helix-turn-helix domain-containing protein [Streptomyces sp. NPDC093595]|uniref:helix-turn-helix domain-containing protein n=1 Tax=Streptomyces sp. NPDC093595 TaxID=3366045 RepID=UPI00380AC1BB